MSATDSGYSTLDLRRMGEDEARQSLTVVEYERWQKLHELKDEAEETREEWAEQSETVMDLTVHADMSELGTEVEVYGNELLVHIDPEDDETVAAAEALREEYDGVSSDDVDDLDDADVERLGDLLTEMLGAILIEFNGTPADDLRDSDLEMLLEQCREKWGITGLVLAWGDIVAAVNEDREERMDVMEKFRDPKGRGNSPAARHDGMPNPQ